MEISAQDVKKLREKTGSGLMDCKNALVKAEGDFVKAEKILKELGLAAAQKRSGRKTKEGSIFCRMGADKGILLEVSCETDFVARSQVFKDLGASLCLAAIENGGELAREVSDELINAAVGRIKENMELRRYQILDQQDNDLLIEYIHGGGQIGVIVKLSLSNGALKDKYDLIDLTTTRLPYQNITLLETVKLFDDIFWYSDDSPSLDIINTITKEYLQSGGKAAFSMTFRDSSSTFPFSLSSLQSFIPVDSLGQEKPLSFLFPGAKVEPINGESGFPALKTGSTIGFVRTYYPNTISSSSLYNLNSSQLKGDIAILNNTKNLFFIGLPLHQCNANNNVKDLLEKVFYQEFNFNQ